MNPWDKGNKRSYTKRSSVTSFSGNWRDINWKELYKACEEVQSEAVETSKAENRQRYNDFIQIKLAEKQSLNPEGGVFEGDIEAEYPFRDVPSNTLFKLRSTSRSKVIEDFIQEKSLKSFSTPLLQSIIKHISTYKLSNTNSEDYESFVVEKDSFGRAVENEAMISASRLYRQAFTDDNMMGLYYFLMLDSRSCYLDKQYLAPSKAYCALVPLIMMAFKLHHGVPYNHWNQKEVVGITNSSLYEAMLYNNEFTNDQILEARAQGLNIKTGPTQGQTRNPLYTYKLYGASLFNGVPITAQTIMSQIWCAHPSNRTKYMVLDTADWDRIPPSLIKTDVVSHSIQDLDAMYSPDIKTTRELMPWEI